MNNQFWMIFIFIGLVNLGAFLLMAWDKAKARQNNVARISEGLLFFMATAFGSLGVYAGMFAFHHKTKKWYFILGIPLLMAQNSALIYLVYLYLN